MKAPPFIGRQTIEYQSPGLQITLEKEGDSDCWRGSISTIECQQTEEERKFADWLIEQARDATSFTVEIDGRTFTGVRITAVNWSWRL